MSTWMQIVIALVIFIAVIMTMYWFIKNFNPPDHD